MCNDCRARQRHNCAAQLEQRAPPNPNPPTDLPPPPSLHPLLGPAISPEDHNYLQWVCEKWNAIQLESCGGYEQEWFDLGVRDNLCKDCQKPVPLFHKDNNMYPGPGCPDLPPLTQLEEMLISPVHALIQVCSNLTFYDIY